MHPPVRRRAPRASLLGALALTTAVAVAAPAAALPVTLPVMLPVGPGAVAGAVAPTSVDGADGACAEGAGVTVVVDLTDLGGDVEIGCAEGDPASGTEALTSAGFTEARAEGGYICAIAGRPDPCPTEFDGSYWAYWSGSAGGDWEMQATGSDESAPAVGTVEGWRYNDGSAPPSVTPDEALTTSDEPAEEPTEEPTEDEVTEEPTDAAEDESSADDAEQDADAARGLAPLVAAGAAVVLVALAAVAFARRRASQHGPAGQD